MKQLSVLNIPIDDIEEGDRLRPADPSVVASLKVDIAARGLRSPIEVSAQKKKGGKPYRLVAGLHRISACRALGWTHIPAIVVSGNRLELRRDEILENLTRSELTALEECIFLRELKAVWIELHPEKGHGGDRRSDEFQDGNLPSWSEVAAQRTQRRAETLKRKVRIGERLDSEAVNALRGSAIEHNQSELEALTHHGPELQRLIAGRLTDEKPARSVRAALAALQGQPEAAGADQGAGTAKQDRALTALADAWGRCNATQRLVFLSRLIDEGSFRPDGAVLGWLDPAEAEG